MVLNRIISAVNHVLIQDPSACDRLIPHAGKVVCLDLDVVRILCRIGGDGLFDVVEEGLATVILHVRWVDVPLMCVQRDRLFSFVRIEGDAECAHAIAQVAGSVRWEAEEDLSHWVGDIAAMRLVSGVETVTQYLQSTQKKWMENVAEYFVEEQPVLVRPQEIMDFGTAVIKVRDDVERTEKRIKKLKTKLDQTQVKHDI